MMDEFIFYDTLRAGLWIAVMISLPILTVALLSGLIVGLFQALSQVHGIPVQRVAKPGVTANSAAHNRSGTDSNSCVQYQVTGKFPAVQQSLDVNGRP